LAAHGCFGSGSHRDGVSGADGGARDANARNLAEVLERHPHNHVAAGAIPTSAQVAGPANDAAAVCSAASVQSVSPAPVRFGHRPPPGRPVFPRSGWPTGSGMVDFGRKNLK
jgi:hypothetical protein